MKEKFNRMAARAKTFWAAQTPNKKNTYIAGGCGAFVLAVLAVLFIKGLFGGGYVVLYPGINETETSAVMLTLREKGVDTQLSKTGELMVPEEKKDELLISLASEFPKTAPNYGIYSDLAGFTATESDRKVYLNAMLQDRIQETLQNFSSVRSAVVTIVVPDESNRLWEQTKAKSTASVTLTLVNGKSLSPEEVTTVKNIVATSVPKLDPMDVVVVDAGRNIELESTLSNDPSLMGSLKRADLEAAYEKKISKKVEDLLSGIYGRDGVRAVSTVVFDYDKMLTEEMQYVPQENGQGIVSSREDRYTVDGNAIAEGIPGEDSNTNIPTYENQNPDGTGQYTDVYKDIDYQISYIKKQIERGEAPVKDATMSVMVRDADFNDDKRDQLLDSISKAVNIPIDKIALTNAWVASPIVQPVGGGIFEVVTNNPILIAVGAAMLILIIAIIIYVMGRGKKKGKAKKPKKGKGAVAVDEVPQLTSEEERARFLMELEEQKRKIRESYGVTTLDKDSIISTEVREFTAENPEIAATLIRAWMKEDE